MRATAAAMGRLEVSTIRSFAKFVELRAQWSTLRAHCDATPFQSPEWLIPWWECFGGEQPLFVFTVRENNRLVGLAPMYVHQRDTSSPRQLLLLGSGNTDHIDGLFAPEVADAAAARIIAVVAAWSRDFDVCEFQQLPPTSPFLRVAAPIGWHDDVTPHEPCPLLALPRRFDELASGARVCYYRRRAEREGGLIVETAAEERLDEMLDVLSALHESRWRKRGMPGVVADAAAWRFVRRSARELLRAGILRLHVTRVRDEPIAAYFGLLEKSRSYNYLGGFDPAHKRLSPGTLMVGHAIEDAIHAGATGFDFLRGREAYKYRWGAVDQPKFLRTLRPRAL